MEELCQALGFKGELPEDAGAFEILTGDDDFDKAKFYSAIQDYCVLEDIQWLIIEQAL